MPPTEAPTTTDDLAERRKAQEAEQAESDREAAEALGGQPGNNGEAPADEGDFEGEGDDEQPKIFDLELEGDKKLDSKVGGKKPDKATVKMRGGSITVPEGQYEKGDVINLAVRVRCTEVHFVDKMDNTTGEVVETERRQIMRITGVEKV